MPARRELHIGWFQCPLGANCSQAGFNAHSARIPIVRLKTCLSLFEIHPDSPPSAKGKAEGGVDRWSNVAGEFKRAGFLEWRCDWHLAAERALHRRRFVATGRTETLTSSYLHLRPYCAVSHRTELALALPRSTRPRALTSLHQVGRHQRGQSRPPHGQAAFWLSRQCLCLLRTFKKTAPI
jgi:hypothetical protein